MFTCSRCSFQHAFEWAMNEHIYVKHGIVTDMTPRGEIPRAPTKLRVGPDGVCAPTTDGSCYVVLANELGNIKNSLRKEYIE